MYAESSIGGGDAQRLITGDPDLQEARESALKVIREARRATDIIMSG